MKIFILLFLSLQLILLSCHPTQKAVNKTSQKQTKYTQGQLLLPDNLLVNQNPNSIVYVSRKEYYRKLHKKPIGLYRGYGEASGEQDDVEARRLADQRALLDIASQIRINISSTSMLQKTDAQSVFRQEITTNTFATLKNAKPTRWYDRTKNTFYTIMEINRNAVNSQLQKLAERIHKESVYYFKKALAAERFNNLSMAFHHYISAYYIATQSFDNTIEYYDTSSRRTYDVQIESKIRIQNILNQLRIKIVTPTISEQNKRITILAQFNSNKPIPFKNIPLQLTLSQNDYQKSLEIYTDNYGQADLRLAAKLDHTLPTEIKISIDFSQLIKGVSKEFYGFIDPLFQTNISGTIEKVLLYLEPIYIDVLYYVQAKNGLPGFQINSIHQQNIHLFFYEGSSSKIEIERILRTRSLDIFSWGKNSMVIIGRIDISSKNWGANYLLSGSFYGIYTNRKTNHIIKNININTKAYGSTQNEALRDFSQRISQSLLKALTH